MQKFYFQAVTQEGKQISGFVSAKSLDEARDKLRDGNMSILTLEEPQDTMQSKEGVKVFDFEATNEMHRLIRGTIESNSHYEAFKKLRLEYKLEVGYLVDSHLPHGEKEKQKLNGIAKELEDRLQIEIKMIERKEKKDKKKKKPVDEVAEAVEANEKKRQFIVEKIDSVLAEIVPLMEENSEYIDAHKKREIEERIDLLLRLKHSNSVEHLKSLAQRLLKQISSDEIFLKDANIPPELRAEINRRRGQFQAVGDKFDKVISKGLVDLQVKLASIDTEGLKDVVTEIKIFRKVINIFYFVFGSVFVFCTSFLTFYGLKLLIGNNPQTSYFYLSSALIWYMMGMSLVMMISFVFFNYVSKEDWKNRAFLVGGTVLALLTFSIQFPVFFFWTV